MTTPGATHVELLTTAAVPAYVLHLCRNALESGRDGDPFSRARSADDPPDAAAIAQRLDETWRLPVTCPGWERGFGGLGDRFRAGGLTHAPRAAAAPRARASRSLPGLPAS